MHSSSHCHCLIDETQSVVETDLSSCQDGVRIVRLKDVCEQPWKNGGGSTRLLAEGVGWRISLATVGNDGPFSVFDGWWRHSVVVGGGGLRLSSNEETLDLAPHRIMGYDGGVERSCELVGEPASVLNVMCEARTTRATVCEVKDLHIETRGVVAILPVNCSTAFHVGHMSEPVYVASGSLLLAKTSGRTINCSVVDAFPGQSSYLLVVQFESLNVVA